MTDLGELLDALRAERRRNAILNIENRLLREGTLELTGEVERLREALERQARMCPSCEGLGKVLAGEGVIPCNRCHDARAAAGW